MIFVSDCGMTTNVFLASMSTKTMKTMSAMIVGDMVILFYMD